MTCLVLRVCVCIFWDENSDGPPRVFRLWDIFGPVFTELVSHWVVNALCVDDSCFVPKSFDRWLFDWFPRQIKTLFKFRCQDTSSNCRWQLAAVICRRCARKMWAGRYETNTLKDQLMLWALRHGGWWLVVWCFSYEQPLSVGIWSETLTVTSNHRQCDFFSLGLHNDWSSTCEIVSGFQSPVLDMLKWVFKLELLSLAHCEANLTVPDRWHFKSETLLIHLPSSHLKCFLSVLALHNKRRKLQGWMLQSWQFHQNRMVFSHSRKTENSPEGMHLALKVA